MIGYTQLCHSDKPITNPKRFLVFHFTNVTFKSTLATFHHFLDCPTCKNQSIDLLYPTNGKVGPQLDMPVTRVTVSHTSGEEAADYKPLIQEVSRRGCGVPEGLFPQSADWNAMLDSLEEETEGSTHCITDILTFCRDAGVPVKTIQCFPNSRTWIASKVKAVLNWRKRAFRNKYPEEVKRT